MADSDHHIDPSGKYGEQVIRTSSQQSGGHGRRS
jgi:hypothetical protein